MKEMHTRFFFTFKISTHTPYKNKMRQWKKGNGTILIFFLFFCCRCRRPKRFEEEKKITRKPNEQKRKKTSFQKREIVSHSVVSKIAHYTQTHKTRASVVWVL